MTREPSREDILRAVDAVWAEGMGRDYAKVTAGRVAKRLLAEGFTEIGGGPLKVDTWVWRALSAMRDDGLLWALARNGSEWTWAVSAAGHAFIARERVVGGFCAPGSLADRARRAPTITRDPTDEHAQ